MIKLYFIAQMEIRDRTQDDTPSPFHSFGRCANILFDHDKVFGAGSTVDLPMEMIPETARLILVDCFGKATEELSDLQTGRISTSVLRTESKKFGLPGRPFQPWA